MPDYSLIEQLDEVLLQGPWNAPMVDAYPHGDSLGYIPLGVIVLGYPLSDVGSCLHWSNVSLIDQELGDPIGAGW